MPDPKAAHVTMKELWQSPKGHDVEILHENGQIVGMYYLGKDVTLAHTTQELKQHGWFFLSHLETRVRTN